MMCLYFVGFFVWVVKIVVIVFVVLWCFNKDLIVLVVISGVFLYIIIVVFFLCVSKDFVCIIVWVVFNCFFCKVNKFLFLICDFIFLVLWFIIVIKFVKFKCDNWLIMCCIIGLLYIGCNILYKDDFICVFWLVVNMIVYFFDIIGF